MMMMRFQFKSKKQSRGFSYERRASFNKKTPIVVVLVLVLVFVLWPGIIQRPLEIIGDPLWRLEKELSSSWLITSPASYLKSKKTLNEELDSLKQQVAILEAHTIELELLRDENIVLNSFLNRRVENKVSTFAYIIRRPNATEYDTLLLDVGFESDIEPGDLVSYDGMNVLGEIVKVGASTSLARLFSSPDMKSSVVISDSLSTTAMGLGGGNLEITLPRDISVEKGMVVRLEKSPRTILGYIESIEKTQSDTFQRILVRSTVNIYEIEGLMVYKR